MLQTPWNPLNSLHFDAPNTKFAQTGYRRDPNSISQHNKQELSAKPSIIPKGSTNQVSIKRLINAIQQRETNTLSHVRQIHYHSSY